MEYRGFTIETDWTSKNGHLKYWEHQNDDSTKFATSETETWLEIDDIIIERQVKEIKALRIGLLQVLGAARASRDTLKNLGIQSDLLNVVIEDNERLIKQLES